ncbi:vWA domain-containing protein [Acanthopleuribacter pedis]|uniref:VWA domain-containing protein n=1 Tax=Acanthopleuribacter pedis TaxID=442870 RepID=A0A8J7QNY5_9BACT|nr:VWA domain-containing protein [Acanthopleuribacter pedis]MBO1321938.1 VWA domain-containing protein [Acanthopleuribacter pedis]
MSHFLEEVDLVRNPEPRIPCVLLLDTSGSMIEDDNIHALNEGVQHMIDDIKADSLTRKRVELAIVTFGGRAIVRHDFQDVVDLTFTPFQATGGTPMGEAITTGLRLLENRKQEYKKHNVNYFRPIMWLMTDGLATDDIQGPARKVARTVQEAGLNMFCVGVEGADFDQLKTISPSPMRLKDSKFTDMFMWLSNSMKAISESQPGQKVAMPPGHDVWGEIQA